MPPAAAVATSHAETTNALVPRSSTLAVPTVLRSAMPKASTQSRKLSREATRRAEKPTVSICLREATSARVIAKTTTDARSRTRKIGPSDPHHLQRALRGLTKVAGIAAFRKLLDELRSVKPGLAAAQLAAARLAKVAGRISRRFESATDR